MRCTVIGVPLQGVGTETHGPFQLTVIQGPPPLLFRSSVSFIGSKDMVEKKGVLFLDFVMDLLTPL